MYYVYNFGRDKVWFDNLIDIFVIFGDFYNLCGEI